MTTVGLVRVTIVTPHRRMDMALPERAPMAELLPTLLRRAGESLADDGVLTGGWVLRRADGTAIESAGGLGAYQVQDGEVLYLVPRIEDWPELEYDDLVDAIASGAGKTGRLWSPQQTRRAGLAVAAFAVLLAVVAILRAGPSWEDATWTALTLAALLLGAGTLLARAFGDAAAGAVLAALAMVPAACGGALALGGSAQLSEFSTPHALPGCAALLLTAILGYVAVADGAAVFVGAATFGALGGLWALLEVIGWVSTVESAALLGAAVLIFSPLIGPLAIRMGRLPMPVLPKTSADLVRDDPQPPRSAVYAAVLRSDGLLTGMIWGSCLVAAGCQIWLAVDASTSAIILLFLLTIGFLIRARLYPAIRQRVPIMIAGLAGAAGAALIPLMADESRLLTVAVPLMLLAAAVAMTLGMTYSRKPPGAYVGRYAELLEVMIVLFAVPVACSVLGLFGWVRGLGG